MDEIPRIAGLTWRQIIEQIETCPTVPVWPHAGASLGYRSKSAAYDAAARGLIRTIPQGRKKPVATSWLRRVLGLKKRRQRLRKPRSTVAIEKEKAAGTVA